jgi:hypothetical protein
MTAPTELPEWDTTEVNVLEPTTEKVVGISVTDFDPEQFKKINYMLNLIYKWCAHINTGASGTFTSQDGKTIVVDRGIITSIV